MELHDKEMKTKELKPQNSAEYTRKTIFNFYLMEDRNVKNDQKYLQ